MLRFLANILFFILVLYFPWWMGLIFGLICLFVFRLFFEFVLWAIVTDLLYGTSVISVGGFNMILSLGALGLFIVSEISKKYIRFYN